MLSYRIPLASLAFIKPPRLDWKCAVQSPRASGSCSPSAAVVEVNAFDGLAACFRAGGKLRTGWTLLLADASSSAWALRIPVDSVFNAACSTHARSAVALSSACTFDSAAAVAAAVDSSAASAALAAEGCAVTTFLVAFDCLELIAMGRIRVLSVCRARACLLALSPPAVVVVNDGDDGGATTSATATPASTSTWSLESVSGPFPNAEVALASPGSSTAAAAAAAPAPATATTWPIEAMPAARVAISPLGSPGSAAVAAAPPANATWLIESLFDDPAAASPLGGPGSAIATAAVPAVATSLIEAALAAAAAADFPSDSSTVAAAATATAIVSFIPSFLRRLRASSLSFLVCRLSSKSCSMVSSLSFSGGFSEVVMARRARGAD